MPNHVTLKELRKTLYECRDFELAHLWQRSIFLTAFLLACFTGYGHIVIKIIETCPFSKTLVLHEIEAAIALFGIIFSIIWIMMAKASKAWYEVYEHKISKIEEETELNIPTAYRMDTHKTEKLDSNILTAKAGKYSPSKLNIFIGKILLIIWGIIFIIHMGIFAFHVFKIDSQFITPAIVFCILFVVFCVILITALCNTWAKSSAFDKKPQE